MSPEEEAVPAAPSSDDYPGAFPILAVLLAVGIVFRFAGRGLLTYFTGDDLMNLHGAWVKPWTRLLGENVLYFSSAYRPMGNLVYRLVFELAGLHPRPFRVVCFGFIVFNLFLAYRTAAFVASREVAAVTAILGCLNFAIDVYHDTAVIYDLVCFTFFFLAFGLYAQARKQGRYLSGKRTIGFLALYICALDSKEMAVALPFVLIVYELLLPGRQAAFPTFPQRRWAPLAWCLLLTVPYVFGKLSHSSPLSGNDAYRLQIGIGSFAQGITHYMDLLAAERPDTIRMPMAIAIFVLSALLAIVLRDRQLGFEYLFALLTSLPVLFVGLRSAYVMYIPWFGVALYLASALSALRRAVGARLLQSRQPLSVWTRRGVQGGTILACGMCVAAFSHSRHWDTVDEAAIRSTVVQLRELHLTVPPTPECCS